MSTGGIRRNDFHRFNIPSSFAPNLVVSYTTRPSSHPSVPSMSGDDVRSSISQPEAGDDMDNLACEFSPTLDMVLRLHAPLQVRHARDEEVMVCVGELGCRPFKYLSWSTAPSCSLSPRKTE